MSNIGNGSRQTVRALPKVAMPLTDATLTTQEVLDLAAFVNSHKRPKLVLAEHLPDDVELGEYNGAR